MRIRWTSVTGLVAVGTAAAAIAVAPIAAADDSNPAAQTCYQNGAGTQCQSWGNAQLNDAPPPVQFYPYGGESGLLGGGGAHP